MSENDNELDVMFYWDEEKNLVLRVFTSGETLEYDFDDLETFKLFSFLKRKLEGEKPTSLISRIYGIFTKGD